MKEYNANAIHILEGQLLEERKKVAQYDLRIIELEQLLNGRGVYHARAQSSQDYDNLPVSRPDSTLPSELGRAKRALADSENYVRQ